jgi:hypothetical protein
VDLSGLIFVALAVAWAAYLIPKALRHHDDAARGRSIDRFSHSMRVLARREPVSSRAARLVEAPVRPRRQGPASEPEPSLDEQYAARRDATRRSTRRRRRVLAVLLLAVVGAAAAAALGRLDRILVAVPVGLLVCWLVACRVMVKKERAWSPSAVIPGSGAEPAVEDPSGSGETSEGSPSDDATSETPAVSVAADGSGLWDPVPVTLPTYVSKPPARRAVRTIDLDATGVWTSGRTESDAALAREADAAEAADRVRRRTARAESAESADGEAVGS